jgi:hypothetical protein
MTPAEPAATPTPQRKNQRRSRRQPPKGGTRVRAYGNLLGIGANLGVKLLDLSETGVRLVLKSDLPPGQQFVVELESIGSRAVRMPCIVVWSVEAADGGFVVGAAFQKTLSYLDLHTLAKV